MKKEVTQNRKKYQHYSEIIMNCMTIAVISFVMLPFITIMLPGVNSNEMDLVTFYSVGGNILAVVLLILWLFKFNFYIKIKLLEKS